MTYCEEFFDLQLRFAYRVAAISKMPLAGVLLDYTNFYVRFGLGRDFNAEHPLWREYVAGLERSTNHRKWTCDFYLAQPPDAGPPSVAATVGCFSYARLGDNRIRLHFHNADGAGHSPLAAERRDQRLAELRSLFAEVRRSEHPSARVVGASWLYNLAAYRRLFPGTYLATATAVGHRFRYMPLWGQFLDRRGAVKQSLVVPFLCGLSTQSSLEGLAECFPFQVLALEAPVSEFFTFYALKLCSPSSFDRTGQPLVTAGRQAQSGHVTHRAAGSARDRSGIRRESVHDDNIHS